MPNRLAAESSPYLLQHANNPVDWFPWGDEAIEKSKMEDKPIFLSIGYSACHWCHVMEHESFEDEEIAAILNEHFVSIKVDREERPDLDQIYMMSVQMMTGRGGWPMSVFLTPDLKPFFGGTYWPPRSRGNMPGFDRVLNGVLDAWNNRREQATQQAAQITDRIAELGQKHGDNHDEDLTFELIRSAGTALENSFDFTHGGFGQAPKFPHPMDLQLLLRIWKHEAPHGILHMVNLTLQKMASGGIYDHLAGGFARYSVDERWLVPHFEKMLYDNALLTNAFVDAYLATHQPAYKQTIRETLDYTLNYLTDERGGFHSTEDADSEGEEGKFYVWTADEIDAALQDSKRSEQFKYVYGVTESGNFEGRNILNLSKTVEQCAQVKDWDLNDLIQGLSTSKSKLLAVRDQRIRPSKDDKVLVSWNGLMIDAMARAGWAIDDERFVRAAENAANFIRRSMVDEQGNLLHTYRKGKAKLPAFLDDYACLANSVVSLYEATFDETWIDWAVQLVDEMLNRFSDDDGTFFFASNDHKSLVVRTKDMYDSSVPSGNGMAATVLIRLAKLCGRRDYLERAEQNIKASLKIIKTSPKAAGQTLLALDHLLSDSKEIVVAGGELGQENKQILALIRQAYSPNLSLTYRDATASTHSKHLQQIWSGRESIEGQPTCFICVNNSCEAPIVGFDQICERISAGL